MNKVENFPAMNDWSKHRKRRTPIAVFAVIGLLLIGGASFAAFRGYLPIPAAVMRWSAMSGLRAGAPSTAAPTAQARAGSQQSSGADGKHGSQSFTPPDLSPTPRVSVVDAAQIVDKAESTPDQASAEPMPTVAIEPLVAARAGTATRFPISINTDGVLREGSKIAIRGVGADAALSSGHSDGAGAWLLTPDELGDLAITPGASLHGARDLVVQLLAPGGGVANEVHTKLVVADDAADGAANARQPVVAATPEEISAFLRHGQDLQRVGYLAGARLFFRHAADAGSAEGARSLGATYDPNVFRQLGVRGMTPDPKLAAFWYERARGLETKTSAAVANSPAKP